MSKKTTNQALDKYKSLVEDAWLNLGDTANIHTVNPFDGRTEEELDRPDLFILKLMRNPENFYFTCRHLFNFEPHPYQLVILREMWIRKYPMLIAARGGAKSTLLGLYAMMRAVLKPNEKILLVGSGFRQSKIIFEYCESIWNNSPILRDIFSSDRLAGPKHENDRHIMYLGNSTITAIPIGSGEKIRGLRATCTLIDEMHTQNPEILETVISGFSSVHASPMDKVKRAARVEALKKLGKWSEKDEFQEASMNEGNQMVISGTASYSFNHFFRYWKKHSDIINSKGDINRLREIFGGEVPDKFSYKDYSIIRLPVELLPKNYMDEKHVARSKATIHVGIYNTEYGAVFSSDSTGFFKRSLIESCVTPIKTTTGEEIAFDLRTRGNPNKRHVFAIDPASEVDNFAITIIELNGDHRRVVYCWTTTKTVFKERLKKGVVEQADFYGYCARKIRDLMKEFPCERIAIDSQGGGVAVLEALNDPLKMKPGENFLFPIIEEGKEKDTDFMQGKHMINVIEFSKAAWVSEANHGMKKDLEDKVLLFPHYDELSALFSSEEDAKLGREYDTLEDLTFEIEELKNELSTIVHTQTSISGRDRWDTPELKLPNGKKGRMRKDRYSSLLMGNAVAREIDRAIAEPTREVIGGFAHELKHNKEGRAGQLYAGPAWFIEGNNNMTGLHQVIRRS